GDSIHLLEYARSLRTIPWHNIYTSLFYIISFSLIPHAAGVVIIQYIFISCVIGYIYSNIFNKYKTRLRVLFFMLLLTPINLFYANWVFRTTICSYLELLTIFYIIFNLENIITSKSKRRIFIILVGFISSYRSENILYILIPIIFINRNNIKEIIKLFITCLIAMILINLPQKIVSKKYYNSDYLITNTYETLQYITNYISEEDIKKYYTNNIRNIIPVEYIRNYGQHAYFEYNYENTDHGTTLNKSQEEQKKYLVDIAKLFFKYKKLYLFNKINGFTEMLYGKTYFPVGMTYSKRTEYFFQKQSNIIKDKFKKEYSYKKDQNPNIYKKLILPFIITILLLIFNLFKKNKIKYIYILLLLKALIITLVCPITIFMYYYYLYLISYYLLLYKIIELIKRDES
ncbi:MAG: hypothetical protein J6G98_03490, partial [Bacilli bacterium]|nr:hypothetical protein [Bacilli bacterium]